MQIMKKKNVKLIKKKIEVFFVKNIIFKKFFGKTCFYA